MTYYTLSMQPLEGSLGADPELSYVSPIELGWDSAVKIIGHIADRHSLPPIRRHASRRAQHVE